MAGEILLGHGGGGRLSRDLIAAEILPRFGAGPLADLPDAARLGIAGENILFTTDSFVVQPRPPAEVAVDVERSAESE